MGTGELAAGGNPAMDKDGGLKADVSCFRHGDKISTLGSMAGNGGCLVLLKLAGITIFSSAKHEFRMRVFLRSEHPDFTK